MKLAYPQLGPHLAKGSLAPIYLISGDEILLVQEAVDAIREAARKIGFAERTIINTEDWGKFIYSDTHSLSLFSTKKIVELNLNNIKFNAAARKALEEYVLDPPENILLIIQTSKLDPQTEKSNWYQAIHQVGAVLPVWPIFAEQLSQWVLQRAKKAGLNLTKQAAEHLSTLVEGNLLAAAQEIEKLVLLQMDNTLMDHTAIEDAVTDHARFDIFSLVDSSLKGNSQRCLRILQNLAAEETEPTLVLWALAREIRTLASIHQQMTHGATLASLFTKYRIWEKRQASVRAAMQRHTQQECWELLIQAGKIDRVIKGVDKGNIWDELLKLTLGFAHRLQP